MKNIRFISYGTLQKYIALLTLTFFAKDSVLFSSFDPDWSYSTRNIYANLGLSVTSVSSAGDVNGDGYDDIIAGVPYFMDEEPFEGVALVFYGSENGLSSSPDWSAESDQVEAKFGWSVSGAGDVNGDGYADVIIGSPGYGDEQNDEGRVFIYYGSPEGLSETPGWTAEINQLEAFFGSSVSSAGDINNDGYSDVVAGSYNFTNDQEYEGGIFVYYGSSSGPSKNYDWSYESDQEWANLGWSVSSAGDVNGDGFSDVIAGAPYFDFDEMEFGSAFVFYGSESGLPDTLDWTAMTSHIGTEYGTSVSSAGDVNGDGYDEVIIGAPMFSGGEAWMGSAFSFYGSSSGLSDLLNWSSTSGIENAVFGYDVSTAGDINGDGYGDVIVGAHGYKNGESLEGAVYLFYGSSTGLSNSSYSLIESDVENALLGITVSCAGDVNGDGYDDIIAGASGITMEDDTQGAIFLWYGSPTGLEK